MITSTTEARVIEVIRRLDADSHACERVLSTIPVADPGRLAHALSALVPGRLVLTGTLERRLLLAETADADSWLIADLSGHPHDSRHWPWWAAGMINIMERDNWLSRARITPAGVHRLTRPNLLLAALYHRENFPLPRFPLGISDLARAVRSTLSGQVRLLDMQLGASENDILAAVVSGHADIVGVSATFGQHDLLTSLLDGLEELQHKPLIVAGGSLTVRNERLLLAKYPRLMIARGAGEPTIADIIAFWHGDLARHDIRGLGFLRRSPAHRPTPNAHRRTPTVANRTHTDPFPELDLLSATFQYRGVAQLESSRGCTHFCSFCPRGHKGRWSGAAPEQLRWVVAAMSEEFDRHPDISRTLYLVDEEFIGRDAGAADRALAVADVLHDHRLGWETSCRVDQVSRPEADRQWHVDRARLWRDLRARGLRRCLFGVESGVDSILRRFAKESTGAQNALAIRTLSALGVPTRFTYITFDHLMTAAELSATHEYLGRQDLLLSPLPHLSAGEIVDGVRDPEFVARHAIGAPLHTAVSYPLVSMECLVGAAYTRRVQSAGLAGAVLPSLGRVEAEFADWRIGRFSHHAQLWIDRQFAFDYLLKSLEKVLDGPPRHAVRAGRAVFKSAAHSLLGTMVALMDDHHLQQRGDDVLDHRLRVSMEALMVDLRDSMAETTASLRSVLTATDRRLLMAEYERWSSRSAWELINAADACGD